VFRGEPPGEAIAGPIEYRHTLSTLINGLVASGFAVTRLEDEFWQPDASAEPGTSEHFNSIAPSWLGFWATRQPGTGE